MPQYKSIGPIYIYIDPWSVRLAIDFGAVTWKWLQGDTDFHHLRGPRSRQDVDISGANMAKPIGSHWCGNLQEKPALFGNSLVGQKLPN